MKTYIHYGHKKFDKDLFEPIKNYGHKKFDKGLFDPIKNCFIKPSGGLWASPIDANFGWKDWCDVEQFRACNEENSFTFTLKPNANVYEIHNLEDLWKLPYKNPFSKEPYNPEYKIFPDNYYIDFEKCVEQGIDAIELCNIQRTLYYALYGWDCESILILNEDIIQ